MRTQRERAGLTREDLAELLGTTTRTLQRVENEGVVGMPLLKQICQVLRLPVVAVLRQDASAIRASLRAHGFAPSVAPRLVGRDAELSELAAQLIGSDKSTVLVIDGPIGVGKTGLAQCLAETLDTHFEGGVVWIRGDFPDARLVQLELARALGFDAQLPPCQLASTGRDWQQAFASHFWRGRRLLIVDDITDESQLTDFICDGQPVTILATTRFKHLAGDIATDRFSLAPLPDAAVVELLATGLGANELERQPEIAPRSLELIGGMPRLAHMARSALRRQRLDTPASMLAGFNRCGLEQLGAQILQGALDYYSGLERQLSPGAWGLFAAMGVFGSEPMPLSWLAAAAGLTVAATRAGASELIDVQIANLHETDDEAYAEPWLRLAEHPVFAARTLLGDRFEGARTRVIAHLIAELGRSRATSMPAMVQYFLEHQGLILELRCGLVEGLGAPPKLAELAAAERVEPVAAAPLEAGRARQLLDLLEALSPLLV